MVVIKAFHESNDKEKTKVYISERKDFLFLYVLNNENIKLISEIEKYSTEKKDLITFFKKFQESFIGFCIAEIKKDGIYFFNYGKTNIGYSSGIDYEYIIGEDTVKQHFVKSFFLASPAYVCKEENFEFDNATKNLNHAESHIEWKK